MFKFAILDLTKQTLEDFKMANLDYLKVGNYIKRTAIDQQSLKK